MPPEQPSDAAIEKYIGLTVDRSNTTKPLDWKIPHTVAGATLERQPIRGSDLESIESSILSDNALASYEEHSVLRETYEERRRLRQTADGSSKDQIQATEYRINQIQVHRGLILGNADTLRRSQQLEADMKAAGLEFSVNPEVKAQAFAHLEVLTSAVNERVSLGRYAALLNRIADGKQVSQAVLDQALALVPTAIKPKKEGGGQEVVLNHEALKRMSPADALRFLEEPIRIAEENVGYLLTYDDSVPGVSQEFKGINPVDLYFNEMLAEAVAVATRREFDLARMPNTEAETARIRTFRASLIEVFRNDVQAIHDRAIRHLSLMSVGFADTSYDPKNESKPYPFPADKIAQLPQNREESAVMVRQVISGFRQRSRNVIGGVDGSGNATRGLMETSIFDFKESWMPSVDPTAINLRNEDFYKKHVRFGAVYPVLDMMTRVQVAPDVIGRSVFRTGLVNLLGTDLGFDPMTFKGEAEKAMVHIRKAWKVPETVVINGKEIPFDFYNPDHWDTLTPEHWAEIQKSQESTMDVLVKNKEAMMNSLNAIEGDLQSFEALYAIRNPDDMIGVYPDEATYNLLQSGQKTVADFTANRAELESDPSKLAACYYFVISGLHEHSEQYAEVSTSLGAQLNEVGDYGIDAARGIEEAGRNAPMSLWFWGMVAGLASWYGTAAVRTRSLGLGAGLRMAKDVPATVRFGYNATSSVVRGGARMAGRTAEVVRGTRTAQELARLRYIQKERQLAQFLQNTRAGRMVSNLKFIRNSRIAGRVGSAFKYGSYAIIPAVGAYEAYLTHQRVRSAEGNPQLQAEYAEGYKTTALETTGYGAAAVLSFGPQIVLTVPVYYAGSYNRDRAEVKTGWAREAADWNREFDSTGLMGQLRTTTLANAVEAGGGGALYPRIAFPSQADQEEAAETIESGQRVARSRIVEAYFTKNLLVPSGVDDSVVKKIIQWKTSYVGLVTSGSYDLTSSSIYEQADLYAELMLRREEMRSKNEDMEVPFTDDEGREGILDFSKLTIDNSRTDIMNQVAQYQNFVRPVEELVLFNTLGQIAAEQQLPEEKQRYIERAKENVRRMMLAKLSHSIYKFDSLIENIDWPGIDSIVSSGDTYSKNVVRSYLARQISKEIDAIIPKVLEGDATLKDYEAVLRKCHSIMQDAQMFQGAENATYEKAAASFTAAELDAAGYAKYNPLLELVVGKIEAE